MMFEAIENFRKRLEAGEVLAGCAVTFSDPLITEALADSMDFVWYDLEHSDMSPEMLNAHLAVARGRRLAALVRVISSDTAHIKPVLDGGAPAIVVPQVRSVAEVQHVVDDCRYPPIGHRGFGPRVPTRFGRTPMKDYVAQANTAVFVAVMIETADAVDAIEDIVAIEGLDSLFIGPMDLSASLGVLGQLDHPRVARAIGKVIAAAKAAKKPVGAGMPDDIEMATQMIKRGVQWLQAGGDFSYMIQRAEQFVGALRDAK